MELLGPNLENIAKGVGLTQRNVIPLICQMVRSFQCSFRPYLAVLTWNRRYPQIDAIEYVHGEGFLHGDIKPSNFVLGRGDNAGRLYLIDFGFAWRYSSGSSHGGRRGTVPYSSLGVLQGEGEWRFCLLNLNRRAQPELSRSCSAAASRRFRVTCVHHSPHHGWPSPVALLVSQAAARRRTRQRQGSLSGLCTLPRRLRAVCGLRMRPCS